MREDCSECHNSSIEKLLFDLWVCRGIHVSYRQSLPPAAPPTPRKGAPPQRRQRARVTVNLMEWFNSATISIVISVTAHIRKIRLLSIKWSRIIWRRPLGVIIVLPSWRGSGNWKILHNPTNENGLKWMKFFSIQMYILNSEYFFWI